MLEDKACNVVGTGYGEYVKGFDYSNTAAKMTSEKGEITNSLLSLHEKLEYLRNTVFTLEETLGDVLKPEKETKDVSNECGKGGVTVVGKDIMDCVYKVQDLEYRLNHLVSRISI